MKNVKVKFVLIYFKYINYLCGAFHYYYYYFILCIDVIYDAFLQSSFYYENRFDLFIYSSLITTRFTGRKSTNQRFIVYSSLGLTNYPSISLERITHNSLGMSEKVVMSGLTFTVLNL